MDTEIQVKVIGKVKRDPESENRKAKLIVCYGGKKIRTEKEIEYKKNDIIFIEEKEDGNPDIIDKHIYTKVRRALNGDISNYALKLNKFTNVHNIPKEPHSIKKNVYRNIDENVKLIKQSLHEEIEWISFSAKIQDKLVIGLGGHSVFENDITLHHIYGIPYIPGQALKGVLRNYIIREHFDSDEEKAVENEIFKLIFGHKNAAGKVIFLDSYPMDEFDIERDVMTPHHSNYYGDSSQLPLDSDTPVPIHFLAAKEPNFNLNLGIYRTILEKQYPIVGTKKTIGDFLLENFIEALNFNGIGAKTAVGYGYFDINETEAKKEIETEKKSLEKYIIAEKEKKLKEIEKQKKEREEQIRFEEDTKNMSELEIKLYNIDKIEDFTRKNDELMKLFKIEIDTLQLSDKKQLAEFVKSHLLSSEKWKYKKSKKGKIDKNSERVKKICEILECDLP